MKGFINKLESVYEQMLSPTSLSKKKIKDAIKDGPLKGKVKLTSGKKGVIVDVDGRELKDYILDKVSKNSQIRGKKKELGDYLSIFIANYMSDLIKEGLVQKLSYTRDLLNSNHREEIPKLMMPKTKQIIIEDLGKPRKEERAKYPSNDGEAEISSGSAHYLSTKESTQEVDGHLLKKQEEIYMVSGYALKKISEKYYPDTGETYLENYETSSGIDYSVTVKKYADLPGIEEVRFEKSTNINLIENYFYSPGGRRSGLMKNICSYLNINLKDNPDEVVKKVLTNNNPNGVLLFKTKSESFSDDGKRVDNIFRSIVNGDVCDIHIYEFYPKIGETTEYRTDPSYPYEQPRPYTVANYSSGPDSGKTQLDIQVSGGNFGLALQSLSNKEGLELVRTIDSNFGTGYEEKYLAPYRTT